MKGVIYLIFESWKSYSSFFTAKVHKSMTDLGISSLQTWLCHLWLDWLQYPWARFPRAPRCCHMQRRQPLLLFLTGPQGPASVLVFKKPLGIMLTTAFLQPRRKLRMPDRLFNYSSNTYRVPLRGRHKLNYGDVSSERSNGLWVVRGAVTRMRSDDHHRESWFQWQCPC